MKIKLLCSLFLSTTLISMNSFALEIYNGKLIKHNEKLTQHNNAARIHINKFNLEKFKEISQQQTIPTNSVFVVNDLMPVSGVVGKQANVSAQQLISIENHSNGTQVYRIARDLCADITGKDDPECEEFKDEIQLDAYGTVTYLESPTIHPIFKEQGTPYIVSRIVIFIKNDKGEFSPLNISDNLGFALITPV